MVFEICFETEQQWERFRGLAAVHAALDGVPDPVSGLLVYRGPGRRSRDPGAAQAEAGAERGSYHAA